MNKQVKLDKFLVKIKISNRRVPLYHYKIEGNNIDKIYARKKDAILILPTKIMLGTDQKIVFMTIKNNNKYYKPVIKPDPNTQNRYTVTYEEVSSLPPFDGSPDSLLLLTSNFTYPYTILDTIGEGGTSVVFRVADLNGKVYAMKVYKLPSATTYKSSVRTTTIFRNIGDFMNEAKNLVKLSHPKLIKVYEVKISLNAIKSALEGDYLPYYKEPAVIIMDYTPYGTVLNLASNYMYSWQWRKIVYRVIMQVAEALDYMHSSGYVHLDVKPENIFIAERYVPGVLDSIQVKLGDLGSATRVNKRPLQFTPAYGPPEQLEAILQGKASPSMDIFALGMTAIVLLTGKNDRPDVNMLDNAFSDIANYYSTGDVKYYQSALNKISQAKSLLSSYRPSLQIEPEVEDLLLRCISVDSSKRPSAKEVYTVLSKYI